MTTAADDRAVEQAFEACLAGRPVPGSAAGLAAFTEAVRGSAALPGRPNAALAELLASGRLADQSSPSTWTAPSAGSSSRVRIRRRFAMILPALLAKLLSAGAVAQAATGAGVVVVAVAGAGTVGVLPGPAQDTFTSLVGDEEVVELPEDGLTDDTTGEETDLVDDGLADPTEVPAVPEPEEVDGTEDVDGAEDVEGEVSTDQELWADEGPAEGESFGSWVARGAQNGWVDGKAVSEWAHKRNEERRRTQEAERVAQEQESEEEVEDVVVEAPEGDVDDSGSEEDEDQVAKTERAGGDRGNGRGNGQGNGRG